MHEAPGGHTSIGARVELRVPVFLDAVADVVRRGEQESGVAV